MRSTVFFTLAMAGVLLAGCSTTGGGSSGALAMLPDTGKSETASESAIVEAMHGGIISSVAGGSLSGRDARRAIVAEYTALETAPVGQSVNWTNERSGVSGKVEAAQPYQVGSQNCRQYTHTVSGLGAAPVVARGTACRAENGAWTPLT